MGAHSGAGHSGGPGDLQWRYSADNGRRADLRVDRQHGGRGVEHCRARPREAAAGRAFARTFGPTVRKWWVAALWARQMVSGRAFAALGSGLLLADRWRAAVGKSRTAGPR